MAPVKHRKILPFLQRVTLSLVAANFLISAGCTPPQSTVTPAPLPPNAQPQDRATQVRLQADKILAALATHNYRSLEPLVVPRQPPLTGRAIAQRLLGQYTDTAELERWDMLNARLSFDATGNQADVHLPIIYQPRPTLPARQVDFFLRFARVNDTWLLSLP